jgi:hypothetical protein
MLWKVLFPLNLFFLFLDMIFPFSYAFFLENIDLYLPNNNEFPIITVTELITILISSIRNHPKIPTPKKETNTRTAISINPVL